LFNERKKAEEALQKSEEEAKRLAQENQLVAEIGRIIGSTLNIEEVYERFIEEFRKLISFDWISINTINLKDNTTTGAYTTGVKVLGTHGISMPLSGSISEEILKTRSNLLIKKKDSEDRCRRFPQLLRYFETGFRSMMSVPLFSRDEVIGALHLRSKEVEYSERDLSLAERVSNQIAGAIANAQLYSERKQAEEALRQSEETARQLSQENAAMAEIGRIISSTLNVEDVYERFAEKLRDFITFDRIVISIFNIEEANFMNVYISGKKVGDREAREVRPLDGSGNAEMLRIKRTLLIQTENLDEYIDRFPGLLSTFRSGFHSIMNVPLISEGRIIGGLLLRSLKPYAYTDKDVRFAERVSNQIAGAIASAKLYSERKQAEEALKQHQEELIKKNKEINDSRQNLQLALGELESAYKELKATQSKILQQEKMASIGQLAAGVAHEINNPMAFISSNLGTLDKYVYRLTEFIKTQSEVIESLHATEAMEKLKLKQKELKLDYIKEDIKGLITESLDGSERVKKIVQGLKSFARVDEAEYKYADINECIESTINIVWNELKYKVNLKKDYAKLPLTKCYPQQMNQVFMNLLINAGHSIEKQGEITIKTWDGDGSIWVTVSDTGHGIPKEDLNKIFEPFFTTKGVGKGTGLGLSISYEIIQKHEGEITVESEVGKGTTFTIRLPIV
jgi:signal transduction histidine kinase